MDHKLTESDSKDMKHNAVTSFAHGIEHLLKYKNGEDNIKFAILHIFNAVELFIKVYLGDINEALLLEDIDKKKGSGKFADISLLLKRMGQFSDVQFDPGLRDDIESLRIKRNDVEHKKFVLENENVLMVTLTHVVAELIEFANRNLGGIAEKELSEELILRFNNEVRMVFDVDHRKRAEELNAAMERAEEFKKKGYRVAACPHCGNRTLAWRKLSQIKCFYCNEKSTVVNCPNCDSPLVSGRPDVIINGWGPIDLCDKCVQELSEDASADRVEAEVATDYPVEEYK